MRNAILCIGLTLATGAVTCPRLSAMTIQFEYGEGLQEPSPQRWAVDLAADLWSSLLYDPVIVTIEVAFSDLSQQPGLDENVVAVSRTEDVILPYAEVRRALVADATSPDDQIAVEHLPPESSLVFRTRTPEGTAVLNTGEQTINRQLLVTPANAKALGLPTPGAIDGQILLNDRLLDDIRADFDPTDGVRGLDFVAIMAHEIAHLLGFSSGVGTIDAATLPDGPEAPKDVNDQAVLMSWDLFRYSPASMPHLDVAPGGAPYFSIDGGHTSLAQFSSGDYNGDGNGPGHWTMGHGLMDPYCPPFTVVDITSLDLLALDVVGWDVVGVPEPSSIFSFGIGCVCLFALCNRRAARDTKRCAGRGSFSSSAALCASVSSALKKEPPFPFSLF